jgi:hypothetical protein
MRMVPRMDTGQQSKRWVTDAVFPSFVIQLVASTVGAMIIANVALLLPAITIAAVTRNTSGGNFVDHVADQHFLHAAGEPYFLAPVLTGLVLGVLSHSLFRSRSAAWVWVLPLVVLLWNIFSWRNGGYRPYWPDVWNNYFGSDCGSSECMYEWFVTAPFYTSAAYSLGWTLKCLIKTRRRRLP